MSLVRNASFLIVKTVVSGKKSVMSTNHCERTPCLWVRAFAPHCWFVHLPNWHFSLHLPPLQCPVICAVDNFQRLRFDSLPTSSQESEKTQIYVYVYISPSLADELLHSKEDEDTSGTANTYPKQRQAVLTISFRRRKVLLLVKSVVDRGVKEYGGGVALYSPLIHRFIDHLINPSIHPLIHWSVHPYCALVIR